MVDGLVWSDHALQRARERFPDIDLENLYPGARRAGKKLKRKIKAACPVSAEKYMRGFNGRYVMVTRCQIVFVMQAPETVVTVFRLIEPDT